MADRVRELEEATYKLEQDIRSAESRKQELAETIAQMRMEIQDFAQ